MTDKQWSGLIDVIRGKQPEKIPVGFIIDSPWLPNWYGAKILDYYTSDETWFRANMKAIETFPDVWFLPGFWSEYGMSTEPSAFGAKCLFYENEFPFAEKIIASTDDIDKITKPNPSTDGLLPFILNRLKQLRPQIETAGHKIRFSVSRGPMNIATFLMGVTEFMTTCLMEPEKIHALMRIITDFLIEWHAVQRNTFPSIDGILLLDDIVGFVGTEEFREFGLPYFKELYDVPAAVKFFHNDAECEASVAFYPEIGINLYNPGIYTPVNKIKELTGNKMTVLGSIPPRDVLAGGTVEEVSEAVVKQVKELNERSRFILSCAGGMPPCVATENLLAFKGAALSLK